MENRAHALAAGAFVLLLVLLLGGVAVWMTRESTAVRTYEISTSDPVNGLPAQAAVRFRGVKVGKVSSIGFDPDDAGRVLLRLQLDANAPVSSTTYAKLAYQGVTGLAFIQLDDGGEPGAPLVAEGNEVPRIPMRPSLMAQWSGQGERILAQLEETSRRVNQLLGDENQRALRQSLQAMGAAAASVPPTLHKASQALQAIRDSATNVGGGVTQWRKAGEEYTRLAQRLQQTGGALEQLQQGAGAIAATAQEVQQNSLPRLNRTLEDAGRSARQAGRAASTLADNPQALLYGAPWVAPGPGEPGFAAPQEARGDARPSLEGTLP